MKVSKIQQIQSVQKYNHQQERAAEHNKNKVESRADQVQISEEAKLLQQAATDPQKLEQLQRLKREVDAGTYHVDAGKLAEKLLPHFMKEQK